MQLREDWLSNTNTTAAITIGSNTATTAIRAINNLISISAAAVSSSVTLFGNLTTGSILIGSALTTGTLILGIFNSTAGIVSNCLHTFNRGMAFLNSNVSGDKIVTGNITTTNACGGLNITTQIHNFGYTFGSGTLPYIVAQITGATNANIVP